MAKDRDKYGRYEKAEKANQADELAASTTDPLYPDGQPIADAQRAHSAEHYEDKSAAEIQAALDERENPEAQTQVPGVASAKAAVEGASTSKK